MKPNPSRTYASNKFEGMSPERIVLALYDGAIQSMERARLAVDEDDQKTLGEQLGRAMAILGELQASLDKDKGGEIGERLDGLYGYVIRTLLDANVNKDGPRIAECRGHIETIREGWAELVEQLAEARSAGAAPMPARGYV